VTKVLYIEDNDDNVYMLKMRLELLGDFEVLAAENGEIGCEWPRRSSRKLSSWTLRCLSSMAGKLRGV
jgi:CheY-like chemotaxis protein